MYFDLIRNPSAGADPTGEAIVALLRHRPSGPTKVVFEAGLQNAVDLGWIHFDNWEEGAKTSLLNKMMGEADM